jgi:Gpi18-like mannosyltransferase
MLALGLVIAPLLAFTSDFALFWEPWAQATQGRAPWRAYRVGANYPPLVLYLLTAAEALRLQLDAAAGGKVMLVAIKLPGMIAQTLCGLLAYRGLREDFGDRSAQIVGVLLVCSPVLFFNAAVWGQYDAPLTLAIVAIVVALLHDRPALAGAMFGLALMTKVQAVVAAPVLAAYVLRRYGMRDALRAAASSAAALIVVALPFVLAGALLDLQRVFTHAVGRFPDLTLGAYNPWYLVLAVKEQILHLPREVARSDTELIADVISYKLVGVIAFALYASFLTLCVWRRPQFHVLIFAQVMSGLAFFMLPTQMHERYAVPAAALATILMVCCGSTRWLFVWLTLSMTLNQVIVFCRAVYVLGDAIERTLLIASGLLALGNCVAFAIATVQFWRVSRPPPVMRLEEASWQESTAHPGRAA